MTRGSRSWVVRSLRDWALDVRQGMGIVTYTSPEARDAVLQELNRDLEARGVRTEILRCEEASPEAFVDLIVASSAAVLYVLDPERVLFGRKNELSPFWVNFHRESLVNRPGVQIWWMRPESAVRFAQTLPDLNRFFLFREELSEGSAIGSIPLPRLELLLWDQQPADPKRSADLIERALRASRTTDADRPRIWIELGIPAIDGLARSGKTQEAKEAFAKLVEAAGDPVPIILAAAREATSSEPLTALLTLVALGLALKLPYDPMHLLSVALDLSPSPQVGSDDGLVGRVFASLRVAVLLRQAGNPAESLTAFRYAQEVFERLHARRPEAGYGAALALMHAWRSEALLELGRASEALEASDLAISALSEIGDGASRATRGEVARVRGMALAGLERWTEALDEYDNAIAIFRSEPGVSATLTRLEIMRASALTALGRFGEALACLDQAIPAVQQSAAPSEKLSGLAILSSGRGALLALLGRWPEAMDALEAAQAYADKNGGGVHRGVVAPSARTAQQTLDQLVAAGRDDLKDQLARANRLVQALETKPP